MRRATPSACSPQRPSRRSLLAGALGVTGMALTGCQVRLEDSAPELPFIPTREPIPAEDALLWLLRDCRELASHDQPESGLSVVGLYEEQVAVLRTALYRAGIPVETLDETPVEPMPQGTSTSATRTSTPAQPEPTTPADPTAVPTQATEPPASPSATRADDGAAAALRRLPELAQCGGGLFPLVISLLAQRWATLAVGGIEIPGEAVQADPARLWGLPFLAGPFARLTDAARYGFEVVAAQSRDSAREVALEALWRINALWREQNIRSGGRAPAPELGYPLPFPVNSEESAERLATHVIDGLIDGYAGLLTDMVGTAQEETSVDLVAWLGSAVAIGTQWGIPIEAFPGTRAPSAP